MMSVKQSEGESDRKSCGRRASQVKNRGNGEKKTGCVPVIQINNVEVDDRGLIYLIDRYRGLHIVERT